jgi:ABC-2 type transport system ATP-binding protein
VAGEEFFAFSRKLGEQVSPDGVNIYFCFSFLKLELKGPFGQYNKEQKQGMIKANNLFKWYGSKQVVDDVSFQVAKGEVLGFLGPNGAGKSTTMRMLTGFLPMSSGSVEIGGHVLVDEPLKAKSLFGYLPENAPAYADMTVEGFLEFTASMRDLSGDAKRDAVEKAIVTCHLGSVSKQSIDTLSKGYRHRTCFAQAILHDPPILILDEPTDGLDPNQKHEMRELIKRMGQDKAIIVSTHILEEVEAICTRVIIIDQGKLVFNGTPAEMRAKSAEAGGVTIRVQGVQKPDLTDVLERIPEAGRPIEVKEVDGALVATIPHQSGKSGLAAKIKAELDRRSWAFDELHTNSGRLDDVFRAITSLDVATNQENN